MNLKKMYETLVLEVIFVTECDVIRTSGNGGGNDDGEWEID